MKFLSRIMYPLTILASVLLSGCVYGPLYPWAPCPVNGPSLAGCYPGPCAIYHPNYFYRCHNKKCTTYSPFAPNTCDPFPYYTSCKYASCCPEALAAYF